MTQPHNPGAQFPDDRTQGYTAPSPTYQTYHTQEVGYSGTPGTATPNPERNGLGLAALILGIVGMLFGMVPLTGFIAFAVGVTGLILGLAGWSRVRKNKATNKKTAIFGVITSVLAVILGIWGMAIFFGALNDLGNDLDNIGNDWNSFTECMDNAKTAAEMDACN